jgi:hypothetical protein
MILRLIHEFFLRDIKTSNQLNKGKCYSLILGGCMSRNSITLSYILREARINL